jgi:hypothetical protein
MIHDKGEFANRVCDLEGGVVKSSTWEMPRYHVIFPRNSTLIPFGSSFDARPVLRFHLHITIVEQRIFEAY